MPLDVSKVGTILKSTPHAWESKDAILYSLGVGAGAADPVAELQFTTEHSAGFAQQVLPTFAVVMGGANTGGAHPLTLLGEFSLARMLHGEQKVVLHGGIPVAGEVVAEGKIAAVHDKGKSANVVVNSVLRDTVSGRIVAETESTLVLRGEGGFGGDPGPKIEWVLPAAAPDVVVSYETRLDQALLYRLSGDRNPLHSDPTFAARGGLPRPILHGLCTFGFAGRALLSAVAGNDPERFGELSARFVRPVMPGETLDTSIWLTEGGAVFQTHVAGELVLDRGVFRLR